jgi:predicted ATPase
MLHRRVAQAIESHAKDLEAVAAELAVHYEEAGWIDRAAAFYARAAEASRRVYSNERAISLFEKALALLEDEPESPDRDRRELALRTALGAPLVSIEGYGAPKVHEDYLRAWELCERLGTPPAPPVLRGLALVSIAHGELEQARAFGEQLLFEGVASEDSTVRVEGNYVLGVTSFWLGEFERSREKLELAIAEYDPAEAHVHIAMYSQDPRVICLARLALTLHYLGEPNAADERAREAISHAEELEHPFSLAYALNFTAWVAIEAGDKQVARERAERMASLADDELLGFVQPMGTILRGWLLAEDGDTDAAVARIREGLEAYAESGWSLYQPYALTLLARVCLEAGRDEEARAAITEALDVSQRTGQRYLDAELHELEATLSGA